MKRKNKSLRSDNYVGGVGSAVVVNGTEHGDNINAVIERMGPSPNVTIGYEVDGRGHSLEVKPSQVTFKK